MRIIIVVLICLGFSSIQAAETDAVFSASTGKLTLPYLKIGGEVYYLEMNLVDAANLLFQISISSIANITPSQSNIGADNSAIVGTWTSASATLVFNADKTYSYSVSSGTLGCPTTAEIGTFQWEASTGVFIPTPTQDGNGNCGFSGIAGLQRISIDGNTLSYSVNNISSELVRSGSGGTNSPTSLCTGNVCAIVNGATAANANTYWRIPQLSCGQLTCYTKIAFFNDGTGKLISGTNNCSLIGGVTSVPIATNFNWTQTGSGTMLLSNTAFTCSPNPQNSSGVAISSFTSITGGSSNGTFNASFNGLSSITATLQAGAF